MMASSEISAPLSYRRVSPLQSNRGKHGRSASRLIIDTQRIDADDQRGFGLVLMVPCVWPDQALGDDA